MAKSGKPKSRRMRKIIAGRFIGFMRRHYEHLDVTLGEGASAGWASIVGSPKVMELAHAFEFAWEACKETAVRAVGDYREAGEAEFDQDGCVKLSDNGYIEPPSVEDPAIRRRDVNGNTEEVRNPNDDGYEDWADLFNFRATILAEIRKHEPTYHERTDCTIDCLLTDLAELTEDEDIVADLDSSERADLNAQLRKFSPPEATARRKPRK